MVDQAQNVVVTGSPDNGGQRPSWDVVKVWNGHRGGVPSVGVYHVGLQKQRLSGQQSSIHPFGGRPTGLIGGGPVCPLSRQHLWRIGPALIVAFAASRYASLP